MTFKRAAHDFQTVRFGVGNGGIIILFRGAKLFGELLRREEVSVVGAGGIVKVFKKAVEPCLIPQRQDHIDFQTLGTGQPVHEFCLTARDLGADVTRANGLCLGLSRGGENKQGQKRRRLQLPQDSKVWC